MGYTATPFANVFIHPEDRSALGTVGKSPHEIKIAYGEGLFPRSFIISLPTPSDYVGPVSIFGMEPSPETGFEDRIEPLPVLRPADDAGSYIPRRHKIDLIPGQLPDSLKEAIRTFILTCAARAERGAATEHNSMLVHVTRFVRVQQLVRERLAQEVKDLVNRLRYGDGASTRQVMDEFREIWNRDVVPTTRVVRGRVQDPMITEARWEDVRPLLSTAAQKVVVKRISGGSEDVLDYQNAPDGASVIAVGGDKLSRGLTLEGLSVSYFLRPSRMYDTLMQMGRWFGYRPGYLDLCRLYTPADLVEWYRHIALASVELRQEFELMAEASRTPREYGLRVRSHPNGLWITSLVKMRESQTLTVSYDGRICETTVLRGDVTTARENLGATNRLLEDLPRRDTTPWEWQGVPVETVLAFLREYRTHPHAPKVNSALLAHYIARRASDGHLARWTVALISSGDREATPSRSFLYPVGLIERRNDTPEPKGVKYTVGRLLSPTDERKGLSEESLAAALVDTKQEWSRRPPDRRRRSEPKDPSGPSLRKVRPPEEALLLLYPLEPVKAELPHDVPVVGIGISFPGDRLNPSNGVEYEANLVYVGGELGDDEDD